MDSVAELAVQELYSVAGIALTEPCGAMRLASAILGRDCVRLVGTGTLPKNSAMKWARENSVIHIREGLTKRQMNHCAAHELGEWHLRASGYTAPDAEELAGQIAAAICVPRPAFHAARRAIGDRIPMLSRAFVVSESLMALRIAECLGTATALITRTRVRTRGGYCDWPATREGWDELVERAHQRGFVVERLRDARDRVVIRAEERFDTSEARNHGSPNR